MLPCKEGFGTMPLSPGRRRDRIYIASYFLGVCIYGVDVRATWHCVCVLTDDGCMQMHDGRGGANVNMGVLFCACMGVR